MLPTSLAIDPNLPLGPRASGQSQRRGEGRKILDEVDAPPASSALFSNPFTIPTTCGLSASTRCGVNAFVKRARKRVVGRIEKEHLPS
jgi:hypothetical protein